MPRLSVRQPAGWNDSVDYCARCYPSTVRAAQGRFAGVAAADIDLDVEHPDYGEDVYSCESCGKQLNVRDN